MHKYDMEPHGAAAALGELSIVSRILSEFFRILSNGNTSLT
jgi:hypothetical protein